MKTPLLLAALLTAASLTGCHSSMTAGARVVDGTGREVAATSTTLANDFPWLWGDNSIEVSLVRAEDGATTASARPVNGKSTWGSVISSLAGFAGGLILRKP